MELARLGSTVRGAGGEGCEHGHCACSGQRRSVHLELDRQWGRWGHIGTATCSVWFPAVSTRGARGILRCVSSDGDVCLSVCLSVLVLAGASRWLPAHCPSPVSIGEGG